MPQRGMGAALLIGVGALAGCGSVEAPSAQEVARVLDLKVTESLTGYAVVFGEEAVPRPSKDDFDATCNRTAAPSTDDIDAFYDCRITSGDVRSRLITVVWTDTDFPDGGRYGALVSPEDEFLDYILF